MTISSIMPPVLSRPHFAFHSPVLVGGSVVSEQGTKHGGNQAGELGTPPETGRNVEKSGYWLCPDGYISFAL